jgi:hypothetical protein
MGRFTLQSWSRKCPAIDSLGKADVGANKFAQGFRPFFRIARANKFAPTELWDSFGREILIRFSRNYVLAGSITPRRTEVGKAVRVRFCPATVIGTKPALCHCSRRMRRWEGVGSRRRRQSGNLAVRPNRICSAILSVSTCANEFAPTVGLRYAPCE